MVTTTPDLVFELVIILNISLVILSLFILVLPVFILSPVLVFMKPLFQPSSPLYSIYPLSEIARTQFFVRWVDCNTPFPEYVLSCVFRFSIVFFDLFSCIYSVLWIPCMIVLSWNWIRGFGVSPSLNRRPDYSILFDLVFPVIRFDRFQFQILFSNILDFLWFSGFFLN